jgi:hypothetical protein
MIKGRSNCRWMDQSESQEHSQGEITSMVVPSEHKGIVMEGGFLYL